MTENRENYIKAIFELQENNLPVSNKILASKLNISPASASQMLSKLTKNKLVINNNGVITLSEEAYEIGKIIISKHRLWESFLLHHFNYVASEVHSDAEVLEHVTSTLLLDRLNTFLNFPQRCPHGGLIYINNLDNDNESESLLNGNIDKVYYIERFVDQDDLINFTIKNNISINDKVIVTQKDQLNETIYFKMDIGEFVISNKIASMIFIKTEK